MLSEARARTAERAEREHSILVVSEDPAFIVELEEMFQVHGVRVIGCVGPAENPCNLDIKGRCPLAEHSSVIVVDSPRSGVFGRRWNVVPAGIYAERLATAHPDSFIILCGAPIGTAGASGEVSHVADRDAAIRLIGWITEPDSRREKP